MTSWLNSLSDSDGLNPKSKSMSIIWSVLSRFTVSSPSASISSPATDDSGRGSKLGEPSVDHWKSLHDLAANKLRERHNEAHQKRLARVRALGLQSTSQLACCRCQQQRPLDAMYFLTACTHYFCADCLRMFVQSRSKAAEVTCPDCSVSIANDDLKELLTKKEYSDYLDKTVRDLVDSTSGTFVQCPNPCCKTVLERLVGSSSEEECESPLNLHPRNRMRCWECKTVFCTECSKMPFHDGKTCAEASMKTLGLPACRYCGDALDNYEVDKEDTCLAPLCRRKYAASCTKILHCGHRCFGCRDEVECPRCLDPECSSITIMETRNMNGDVVMRNCSQTSQEDCVVCYTDKLYGSPCVELSCGHVFHAECMEQRIKSKWPEARITFRFLQCPLCDVRVDHEFLREHLFPIYELEKKVGDLAMQRLALDHLESHKDIVSGRYRGQPRDFALYYYCFYPCAKCNQPYCGGTKECIVDNRADFDPRELVCGACSSAGLERCTIHGSDFIEFKCRYCCKKAVWFCWGTTHFCDDCHRKAPTLLVTQESELPACTCKISHPPNGSEFSLGCALCRSAPYSLEQANSKV